MIADEMIKLGLIGGDLRRLWLHQANANMSRLIAEQIGRAHV